MSKESVQFAEMVRKAYYDQNQRAYLRLHYCEQCGMQKPHRIEQRGRDEIYTCHYCGYQKWYRVG